MTKENSIIDLSCLEEVADWTSSEVAEWFQKIGFCEYSVSNFNVSLKCVIKKLIDRVATLPGKTWKNLEFDNLGKKKTGKTWNFQLF